MSEKQWLARAKETYKFHRLHLLEDSKWTLEKTAARLHRSLGSVCEDIKIASWIKTHSVQLEKFDYAKDALEFIRKKQKEIDLSEIE